VASRADAAFPDALAQAKAAVDFVAGGGSGADAPVVGVLPRDGIRVRVAVQYSQLDTASRFSIDIEKFGVEIFRNMKLALVT